jgi:ADP-heptose:LPS heptosyltransferase
MKADQTASTLFIRLRLLGDIIMSIPALLVFRQHRPETPIYYALEEPFADLADLLPELAGAYIVPSRMSLKVYNRWRRQCHDWGIETVIDLHSGPKSALLTRLTGCPTRIGYKTRNRNWAYTALSESRSQDHQVLHSVVNQISMLEQIGIKAERIPDYRLKIPVHELLLPPGFPENTLSKETAVAIHVGAGNPFRYWGDRPYGELLDKLVRAGVTCHLLGSTSDEADRSRIWAARAPGAVYDWVGRLTIPQTLALIGRSRCYFGPDSGPLHLASLSDTPIVCIYGPNIPAISGPWRKEKVTILESNLTCRPCSQRECRYDTIRCMEVINAESVFQSILRYLG